MFISTSPGDQTASTSKAPSPGSIPQPRLDGLPYETVPDWNNIGLFTAGPMGSPKIGMGPNPVGLPGNRFFHIALRLRPAGRSEHLPAEEVLRHHAREAAEPHYLGVPHPHDVKAAGVLGIDLEAFE